MLTEQTAPLNILLISRCPPYPLHLGDRLIPYNLVKALTGHGHQFSLLAFYQNPQDRADTPYYDRYFQRISLLEEPPRGLHRLLNRAIFKGARFPERRAGSWAPEMWDAIEQHLARYPVDVVHLFGGVHVYEYLKLVWDYPTLITPYESYTLFLDRARNQARSPLQRAALQAQLGIASHYESWMFEGYQRTVVVSDKDADMLRAINRSLPVEIIPNGVDLNKFSPVGHQTDTPTLLFTGNYAYGPNLDAALCLVEDIFPIVKRAIPEAQLLVVGTNPPERLRNVDAPGVHVTGRVPDLRPYFEDAMVYLSPLRLGAGIKNKILEALAMQTAVVATPLSCDGINVSDGVEVLLADTPAALAKAAIRLLQDSSLRHSLAHNGRKLVETRYSWQQVANAYENLYYAVIAEHGQHGA